MRRRRYLTNRCNARESGTAGGRTCSFCPREQKRSYVAWRALCKLAKPLAISSGLLVTCFRFRSFTARGPFAFGVYRTADSARGDPPDKTVRGQANGEITALSVEAPFSARLFLRRLDGRNNANYSVLFRAGEFRENCDRGMRGGVYDTRYLFAQ
jgi:hypothetical protein